MQQLVQEPSRSRGSSETVGRRRAYRRDIDGLRAVAVVAVVLYHAGVPGITGGFVGVDVFFVISGYLITGIVAREIREGRFSIVRFYERRARRILPALFAMICIFAVPASVFLVPESLEAYGRSAAAAALSLSNVHFWRSTGYFEPGSGQLPLLHTWSLGVEEQFYIVLPLYLLALRQHLTRHPALVIGPPVVASLALALYWMASQDTVPAFYLPFGRAWELGIGAALALGVVPALRSRVAATVTAGAGLAAVLAAVVLYDDRTSFPGASALLPCLGAAALIHGAAHHEVVTSRLLELRPVVFTGLISYSLYLWHWPVLVLARVTAGRDLTASESLLLLPVMVGLAVLSWRFVERPFRRARPAGSARHTLLVAVVAITGVAVAGAGLVATRGLPERFPAATRVLAEASRDTNPDRDACDSPSTTRIAEGDLCVLGTPGVEPAVALVGDSFGDALSPGVVQAATAAGASVLVITHAGCRPLVGVTSLSPECIESTDAMTRSVAAMPGITTVVLVGRWTTMVEGVRLGAFAGVESFMRDDQTVATSAEENAAVFARSLLRTVAAFGDKDVWIVGGVAEQEVLVPQAATARAVLGLPQLEGVARADYDERQARAMAVLAAGSGYRLLDAGDLMCGPERCPVIEDGRSLYADDNHVSSTGALALATLFEPVFASR